MSLWAKISQHIADSTGQAFELQGRSGMGGGCISTASRISDGERSFFIKINDARYADMFEAEAEGLAEMSATGTIRVPAPVCEGVNDDQCYIVMEYLELGGSVDQVMLGQQLAAMHRVQAERFGWHRNNTIGSTPQVNDWHHDWISFWRENRLGFQLELAARNGYGGELQTLGERLMGDLPALFETYTPVPSMLHGDLWSGNYGGMAGGIPVIFDPAFYYGDREAEIAMTTLFGGFSRDFYASYEDAWPLDAGYHDRKTFYNLYHIINHANLFGGGYQSQAVGMLKQILATI